nr:amino acid ABC transporter ATP-binding protein [Deinobacterium chartae]
MSKRFGGLEVLHDVNLEVLRGEVVAVIGPSGSGKSTLLRCVNRLEEPDAGVVEVAGVRLEAHARGQAARVRELRQRTAMVFQSFNLFPHLTALENVIEGPITVRRVPRAQAEARGLELLARVGLSDKAHAYPAQLSGGQKQRVAIARALAMDPEVLLLDEPTSALDPELVGEVLGVIRDLALEGRTMLLVTHEMRFARDVARRVVFMDGGRVVEQGEPQAFFAAPRTERARRFLGRFEAQRER